ncbi:MAG: oxidoreductase [Oscillochloris sp.]|nr:oxidoreductase [Oscillochloris sp.]
MRDPLHVALVGYGYAGKTFHAPLIVGTSGLRLAAAVSSDPARVRADWPELPVFSSIEDLCLQANVDLVVVATPNATHYSLARAALLAGKHVVVDKPFTVALAEAQDLAALAAERQLLLSVFHNRRWDADFLVVSELLRTGRLGRVVALESRFDRFRPTVRPRWREQAGAGSGIWYDLGPHLLDQALQLFGSPDALSADIAVQRDGACTDDYFHVTLRYGALRVILHASMLAAVAAPRFLVHGTFGTYSTYGLDPQEDALRAGFRPPSAEWGLDPSPGMLTLWVDEQATTSELPGPPGNYPAYYAQVRDAIYGIGPNPVPPSQAITVMRLIELGCQSSLERRELAFVG